MDYKYHKCNTLKYWTKILLVIFMLTIPIWWWPKCNASVRFSVPKPKLCTSLSFTVSHSHTPELAWRMHCFVILAVACSHLFPRFPKKTQRKTFHFTFYFCYIPSLLRKESILQITAVHHGHARRQSARNTGDRGEESGRRDGSAQRCQEYRSGWHSDPLALSAINGRAAVTNYQQIRWRMTRAAEKERESVRRRSASFPRRAEGSDTEQSEVWKDNFPQRHATLSC